MTEAGLVLLADIGGTKSRIALARGAAILAAQTWANDDFDGPEALIDTYVRQAGARPSRAAIAVAGPVTGAGARLTNRDWEIVPDRLRVRCGVEEVQLVNDLEALALALPALAADQLIGLRPGEGSGNGQALVANFGTGFNVGLLRETAAGPVAFAAELGHAALPTPVAAAAGDGFATIEHLFAGPGLSRLHRALAQADLSPEAISAAADSDGAAAASLDRMAHLIGLLARELVCSYLPLGGLYLAGSMARAVLARASARAALLDGFAAPGLAEDMPLVLITDDAAALTGLARLAATGVPGQ